MKVLVCAEPLVPSPFMRPSLKQVVKDVMDHPEQVVNWIMSGFQEKIITESTKEERVERFWRGVTILAGIAFFLGFVVKNGIIQIQIEDVD
jgi:hypothetical protein